MNDLLLLLHEYGPGRVRSRRQDPRRLWETPVRPGPGPTHSPGELRHVRPTPPKAA